MSNSFGGQSASNYTEVGNTPAAFLGGVGLAVVGIFSPFQLSSFCTEGHTSRPDHLFVPAGLVSHCELRLLWKHCEY